MALKLDIYSPDSYEKPNWAEFIGDEELRKMANKLIEDIEIDKESRAGWLEDTEMWLDMASQVMEHKSTPWEGASNVKFPLLTTAALQFHARAHQELLKGDRIVKARVIGRDEDGAKAKRGQRVEKAMSTQLLYKMEDWQDDTDRLLFVLPLVGTVFRKTYWSELLKRPASELVLASDLIVNFYATDWARARKTHEFPKQKNEILEQINMGNYRDVDLDKEIPDVEEPEEMSDLPEEMVDASPQEDIPHTIYECHCWLDLDDDGYQEPYIVTVDQTLKEILRILPRYSRDTIHVDEVSGKLYRIESYEYVVPYKFLPDVDSSIYGVGLGKLLGPSNAAIDTIINQLVDAGTLSTMPSGFFGRGVRLTKGGKIRLKPGEWEQVTSSGEQLQKNFFAIPTKEPSTTLFQLLGLLIQSGEKMGSVTEALSGENPGQNQPFSTTNAVMEQGMQVFLGIYKRVYRSMTKEFQMLFRLNATKLGLDSYSELLDEPQDVPEPREDFSFDGLDIIPEADPSLANSMRKQRRVHALIEAKRAGMPLNDKYIAKIFLEAIDEPEPELALNQQPPPPSKDQLDHQAKMKELEIKEKELAFDIEVRKYEPIKDIAEAMKAFADALQSPAEQGQLKQMEAMMDMMVKEHEAKMKMAELQQQADFKQKELSLKQEDMAGQMVMNQQKRTMDHERATNKSTTGGGSGQDNS